MPPGSPLAVSRSRSRIRYGAAALVGLAVAAGLSLPVSAETIELPPSIVPPSTAALTTSPPTTSPPTTEAPAPLVTEQPAASPTTVAPVATTPPTETTPTTLVPKAIKKPKAMTSGAGEIANPRATGAVSIEVNIARQMMTIRTGGSVWKSINVSTEPGGGTALGSSLGG